MRIHVLKCWPESFSALHAGTKTYEVRKDDRGYMVGDILRLREWEPGPGAYHINGEGWFGSSRYTVEEGYTGRSAYYRVSYMTPGGRWGLPEGVCVLGVVPCEEPKESPDAR